MTTNGPRINGCFAIAAKSAEILAQAGRPLPAGMPSKTGFPTGLRYAEAMLSRLELRTTSLALLLCGASVLVACSDNTGGYPPPPPPYEPPAEAVNLAKEPKFQPLIKALLEQRKAAKALAELSTSGGGDSAKYGELFGKSRAASKAVGEAVAAAQLTNEERAAWDSITSLEDARLEELLKK